MKSEGGVQGFVDIVSGHGVKRTDTHANNLPDPPCPEKVFLITPISVTHITIVPKAKDFDVLLEILEAWLPFWAPAIQEITQLLAD